MTEQTEKQAPQEQPAQNQAAITDPSEVDRILGQFADQGFVVAIHRRSPRWCQGYCDTWPLDDGFSLADIRESFGGRQFQLKIQKPGGGYLKAMTVWIDEEPKRYGRRLLDPGDKEEEKRGPDPALADVLAQVQAANDRTFNLLSQMLTTQQQQARATTDPTVALTQSLALLDQLKGAAAAFAPPAETDGGSRMIEMFMQLMAERKANGGRAAPPPEQKPRPLPAARPNGPPGPIAPPAAPRPAQAGSSAEPIAAQAGSPPPLAPLQAAPPPDQADNDQADDEDGEGMTLDEELATLEPEEVGAIVGQYLDRLGPEETRRAMSALLNRDASTVERLAAAAAPVMSEESPA